MPQGTFSDSSFSDTYNFMEFVYRSFKITLEASLLNKMVKVFGIRETMDMILKLFLDIKGLKAKGFLAYVLGDPSVKRIFSFTSRRKHLNWASLIKTCQSDSHKVLDTHRSCLLLPLGLLRYV